MKHFPAIELKTLLSAMFFTFSSVGFENHFLVSGKFVYILTISSFSLTNTYNRPVYITFAYLNRKCAAFTMDQFKSSERA